MNGDRFRIGMRFGAACLACIAVAYGIAQVIEQL